MKVWEAAAQRAWRATEAVCLAHPWRAAFALLIFAFAVNVSYRIPSLADGTADPGRTVYDAAMLPVGLCVCVVFGLLRSRRCQVAQPE